MMVTTRSVSCLLLTFKARIQLLRYQGLHWERKECLFWFLHHHGKRRRDCKDRGSCWEVFRKKGALKYLAKFTRK